MYKLLLCWRYLLTRYLALACIVSVLLGVATLIVVNSVMGGFSKKLKDRLHGLLSDVIIESRSFEGFPDPEGKMAMIRSDPYLADRVEAMAPALGTAAGLGLTWHINDIERTLSHYIGTDIFPRDIYYFDSIPTDIQAWSVILVNTGAILIAVLFSVLPALRAALLHPVRALRYE